MVVKGKLIMANQNRQTDIQEFLSQKTFAVVGLSRNGKEFSNAIYNQLKNAGYSVYGVNPHSAEIAGEPCYPDLSSLPRKVDGVVIVVPPILSEAIVRTAAEAGIKRVWIHQGAASMRAAETARKLGMSVIDGECLFMHLNPVKGGHAFHRWMRSLVGHMPLADHHTTQKADT